MSRLIEKASVQSRFFLPDIFFGSILNVFREPEKVEDKRGFYGKKNICNPGNVRRITSYNVCYTKLLRKSMARWMSEPVRT